MGTMYTVEEKGTPLSPYRRIFFIIILYILLPHRLAGCSTKNGPVKEHPDRSIQLETNSDQLSNSNKTTDQTEQQKQIDRQYPLYGLVTGIQLKILKKPNPNSLLIGWLRIGARIRLANKKVKSPTCNSGWYPVYPQGWACKGEGIQVGNVPPESTSALSPTPDETVLPYYYYFVKDILVPEYHRLPTRDEQRAAMAFARRYLELKDSKPKTASRFWKGELLREQKRPTVVRKYLDRAFFIAGTGIEIRAHRQFLRTVRGSYVKLSQLEKRRGSSFRGVTIGQEFELPVAWAVRTANSFKTRQREDGSIRLIANQNVDPIERLSIIPWEKYQRIGTRVFHKLRDGNYLKFWFAAVAERTDPPTGTKGNEPWVHIDISQQTLVLYRGRSPVYATIVSTGLEGHDSPVGVFEIRSKHITETMSDLGPEAGDDRYKIEDVPWTQYFKGSIALHGAFWHERFGLRRSHGCINLSPLDAHRVFDHTLPSLPDGWHGISTDKTGLKGSKVLITE